MRNLRIVFLVGIAWAMSTTVPAQAQRAQVRDAMQNIVGYFARIQRACSSFEVSRSYTVCIRGVSVVIETSVMAGGRPCSLTWRINYQPNSRGDYWHEGTLCPGGEAALIRENRLDAMQANVLGEINAWVRRQRGPGV